MPAQHCLWLHREARPRRPRKRSTQRREQRAVNWADLRPTPLPTQDPQLVSQDQDLQLLRAARPGQQRHQREQVTDGEIHKRPQQARPLPLEDDKRPETTRPPSQPSTKAPNQFANPTRPQRKPFREPRRFSLVAAATRSRCPRLLWARPFDGSAQRPRRIPALMPSAAAAASSPPPTSSPTPIQISGSSSAPMLRSAATPREPSGFMTTTFQLPSSGSHSSVCSPAPVAEAAQNVWSAGGPSGAPP